MSKAVPALVDNSTPQSTTAWDIVAMEIFQKGYEDAWAGRPFDDEAIVTAKGCRWGYELGRQFAVLARAEGKRKFKLPSQEAADFWNRWRHARILI